MLNQTYEAIILDTETTQIDEPEVIELGWQAFDITDPMPGAGARSIFKPEKPIQFGAVAVHHIIPDDLLGAPASKTVGNFLPQATYWIGHNIDFDWRALGSPTAPKRICTLALAREVFPECDSHSLGAVMYYLFGQTAETRRLVKGAHSAFEDVGMCQMVLRKIIDKRGVKTLAELYALSEEARIPKMFTFGKFRGQPISAADRGYANWYARQTDPDPYLILAFKRERLL